MSENSNDNTTLPGDQEKLQDILYKLDVGMRADGTIFTSDDCRIIWNEMSLAGNNRVDAVAHQYALQRANEVIECVSLELRRACVHSSVSLIIEKVTEALSAIAAYKQGDGGK